MITMIQPFKNNILFSFLDAVNSKGEFERTDSSSLKLHLKASSDDSASKPRLAKAEHVGPDVKDVEAGDIFLLPPLRWTTKFTHDSTNLWKTDETQVVLVIKKSGFKVLNEYVLFDLHKQAQTTTPSGIFLLHPIVDQSETQKGFVLVGNDTVPKASIIYFVDKNFTHTATIDGVTMSFIKATDIIAYVDPSDTTK